MTADILPSIHSSVDLSIRCRDRVASIWILQRPLLFNLMCNVGCPSTHTAIDCSSTIRSCAAIVSKIFLQSNDLDSDILFHRKLLVHTLFLQCSPSKVYISKSPVCPHSYYHIQFDSCCIIDSMMCPSRCISRRISISLHITLFQT